MTQKEQDIYMLTQPFRELPWWKRWMMRATLATARTIASRVIAWAYERSKINSGEYHELIAMVNIAFAKPVSGKRHWFQDVLEATEREARIAIEVRKKEPNGIMHSYTIGITAPIMFKGEQINAPMPVQCDHCHRRVRRGRLIQGLRFAPRANLCGGCVMVASALIDGVPTEYETQRAELAK